MDIQEVFGKNFIELDSICDAILEGVVIASPAKNFLFWNHAAKQILEDEPENVDPQEWARRFRLYDPDTGDYLAYEKLPMVKALSGEEFYDYRVMTKNPSHPDGLILSVNGKPLRSGNATVGGITTFRDVTEEVKQKKLLETEKNFYEHILDLMPGLVFIKDLKGRYVYGNKHFLELLHTDSVVGKTSNDYLPEAVAKKVIRNDQVIINTGKDKEFEEVITWSDGTRSVFRTTRFPYVSIDGELKGVCSVARDLTESAQTIDLEDKLQSSLSSLHGIQKELTDLLQRIPYDEGACKVKLQALNEILTDMSKTVSSLPRKTE